MIDKAAPTVADKVAPVQPKEETAKAPPKDTVVTSTPQGKAGLSTIISSIVASITSGTVFLTPYASDSQVKTILIGLAVFCAAATVLGGVATVLIQRRHIANGGTV
jgi:hypothetical protein